jgi:hypothetical protein
MGKTMPGGVREIMLKEGLPRVEEARKRLAAELDRGRQRGDLVLKLIHGYGSSGVGGALRDAVRSSLRRRVKEGRIRAFLAPDKVDTQGEACRLMLDECPQLARDRDFISCNEGVTFALL